MDHFLLKRWPRQFSFTAVKAGQLKLTLTLAKPFQARAVSQFFFGQGVEDSVGLGPKQHSGQLWIGFFTITIASCQSLTCDSSSSFWIRQSRRFDRLAAHKPCSQLVSVVSSSSSSDSSSSSVSSSKSRVFWRGVPWQTRTSSSSSSGRLWPAADAAHHHRPHTGRYLRPQPRPTFKTLNEQKMEKRTKEKRRENGCQPGGDANYACTPHPWRALSHTGRRVALPSSFFFTVQALSLKP